MKTVEEILRESGLTDEQIQALDAKVKTGVTQILSSASQTLEQAELAKRAQAQQYDTQIAPALDSWANEKARLDAEVAFYKTQLEGAKAGGFITAVPPGTNPDVPPVAQPRNAAGEFVPGRNEVPGSPKYMTKTEAFQTFTAAQWTLAEYMRLHNGEVPPDDIEQLATEAATNHMPYRDYVAKKYDFAGKKAKIEADKQKAHDDAIRAETSAQKDREWAEKIGSNPNVRVPETSRFSTLDKAVKSGERPDPLKMNREQRHEATRAVINKEIADNSTVQ